MNVTVLYSVHNFIVTNALNNFAFKYCSGEQAHPFLFFENDFVWIYATDMHKQCSLYSSFNDFLVFRAKDKVH